MSRCIVLRASGPYTEEKAPLLRAMLKRQPELFAVVGPGSKTWEDAMDWLCIQSDSGNDQHPVFCMTSSHAQQSMQDAVTFAERWCDSRGAPRDVDIIDA